MSEPFEYICHVRTPDGERYYVTLLPPELIRSQGLAPEAILGVLSRPLGPGERITSDIFSRNSVFVDFLHEVIARHAPGQPALQVEAKRLGNGWVYVIDRRTRDPQRGVPPEDILGAFEVKDRAVVAASYRRSPNHRILSADGFFQLEPELRQCLMEELKARNTMAK